MSCWTRHLEDVMTTAGIEFNKENKKRIDKYVRDKFNLEKTIDCPEVWKTYVKPIISDENKKRDFILEINKLMVK